MVSNGMRDKAYLEIDEYVFQQVVEFKCLRANIKKKITCIQ